jgi:TonB family protein
MSSALLLLQLASAAPQFVGGELPTIPPQAAGGGQVILELTVDAHGSVAGVRVLRDGPPFTAALRDAAKGWRFGGATDASSKALLVGVFRPPALFDVGPTDADPARDVASASEDVPFPIQIATPAYPPKATGDGAVLLEAEVGAGGLLQRARVVRATGAFASAAIEALARWSFRPARAGGRAVDSTAYVVFGFREPVTPPRR